MKLAKNLVLVALSVTLIGVACTKSDSTTTTYVGNWVKRSAFDGDGRSGAICFVVNNIAYIGTGYSVNQSKRYNDLWSFDATTQTWKQLAFMPTAANKRNLASSFAIGTKGYVVGGACDINAASSYDGKLNDMWEFKTDSNLWTPTAKKSLPDPNATVGSGARYSAVGFAIGNYGYISTGYTGTHTKDIYQYDNVSDTWATLPSMPSSDKRQGASVMVYGSKAYIVGGTSNGTVINDMWQFDPSNATTPWKQLNYITNVSTENFDDNYTSIVRSNAVAFVIGDKGYLTTGLYSSYNSTTWEYSFKDDIWTQKTGFERAARADAIGFSVNGRGFVGLGSSSTLAYDNMDEFKPNDTYNAND